MYNSRLREISLRFKSVFHDMHGFCDEVIHLFLASELVQVTAQPEAHEVIEIHWVPFDQALAQVYEGTLRDAKTMLGLTLAEKIIRQ